jgi:polyphosphate kinase 2 (PPK2 family)
VPDLRASAVEDGILLVKYWFSVSDEGRSVGSLRLDDPLRR